MSRKSFLQLAGISLLRAWLVFSALAVLGFAVLLFIDRDDPLRSDAPYLVGFFVGAVGACWAIVYTAVENIAQQVGRMRLLVYAIVLAAWCLLLWAGSRAGGEGGDLLNCAAIASLVIGLLTYCLCRFSLPRVLVVIISCAGLLLLAMYCAVCVVMAQRF